MISVLKPMGKRFRQNPTGQLAHPSRQSKLMNKPSQPSQFGKDGFAGNQSKRKGPIHKGQGNV